MRLQHLSAIIADDQRSSREIAAEILKIAGMRDIRHAGDGGEAFGLVCERAPDFLILNLEMPYDGVKALRQIRTAAISPNRRLPVIMMTAYATPARIVAMRDAGATEVVSKPLTAANLLARIQAALLHPRPFIDEATYVGPDRRRGRHGVYAGPLRRTTDGAGDVFEIDVA
ncbi:MAG: response regulator [Terricaulis sp.]